MPKTKEKKEKPILPNTRIIDLALYFEEERILVIADLHLGYEEALNKQGVLVPRFNFNETKQRLKKIFEKTGKVQKVIILGDLKHEFGRISEQEWNEVILTIELIAKNCNEIILLRGNHDTILGPIASWKNLSVREFYYLPEKNLLFIHGNEMKFFKEFNESEILVIGHEHPSVTLTEGVKQEKFKCFLKGRWSGKVLVVLPSFNSFSEGTDVTKEKLLSPFLQQGLEEFEAWAIEDKPYYFGKLKEL
ncbi:MAG: metallophosphoesterase [Candidatus Diapherotrites archaeon]